MIGRLRFTSMVAACLATALVTVAAISAVSLASGSGSHEVNASALSKAQIKAIKKYAKSYARKYAKTGATGTAGAAGAAGATGAGPAYAVAQGANVDILDASHPGALSTIVTKDLPAGSYVVNASALLTYGTSTVSSGASGRCRLYNGAAEIANSQETGLGVPVFIIASFWQAVVAVQTTINLSSPATLTLKCQDNSESGSAGESFIASDGKLIATSVTGIN